MRRMPVLAALSLWLIAAAAPAFAGDIHIPDANPATGGTIGVPWTHAEVRYQIYIPAAQMGGKKVRISDLAFAPSGSGTFKATTLQIRMVNTTIPFNVNYNLNLGANSTTCFLGVASWAYKANQWSDVGLTTPFQYDGRSSVVVEVRFKGGSGGPKCHAGAMRTYFTIGAGSFNASRTGNILLRTSPKIRLHFDETVIRGSGSTSPGSTVTLDLSSPPDASRLYQVGTSLGTGPIPIDTRKLGLSPDSLLVASTGGTLPGIFANFAGTLDRSGLARAQLRLPRIAALKGQRFHSAFVTLLATAPSGVSHVSNTFTFTVR